MPERLVDLQLLALHDWRVGLQESHSPNPNHTLNSKPVPQPLTLPQSTSALSLAVNLTLTLHSVPAGLHMLWSAAGRSSYVISFIEFDALAAAWDRGHAGDRNSFNVLVDSPTELALQPGEFPVVTFLVFNQYLGIFDTSFQLYTYYLPPASTVFLNTPTQPRRSD